MSDDLLTIKEVAASISMSVGWVKKAVREHELQCVRFGRYIRIRPVDLARYVSARIAGGAPDLDELPTGNPQSQVSEKTVGTRR